MNKLRLRTVRGEVNGRVTMQQMPGLVSVLPRGLLMSRMTPAWGKQGALNLRDSPRQTITLQAGIARAYSQNVIQEYHRSGCLLCPGSTHPLTSKHSSCFTAYGCASFIRQCFPRK
jgi:hypothetical protein